MSKTRNDDEITIGSGNVFADIGLPHPEELLLKAQLMHAINSEIRRRGWTQEEAATATHLKQTEISRIATGRSSGFSSDRLIDVLRHLSLDVEIRVTRTDQAVGGLRVLEIA